MPGTRAHGKGVVLAVVAVGVAAVVVGVLLVFLLILLVVVVFSSSFSSSSCALFFVVIPARLFRVGAPREGRLTCVVVVVAAVVVKHIPQSLAARKKPTQARPMQHKGDWHQGLHDLAESNSRLPEHKGKRHQGSRCRAQPAQSPWRWQSTIINTLLREKTQCASGTYRAKGRKTPMLAR